MTTFTKTGRVVVNSITIPPQFVAVASKWYGGSDCMLYAVSSTGGLTTGTNCPTSCEGCEEKWYLHLWRRLSVDVGVAECAARKNLYESKDEDDWEDWEADAAILADFEEWIDGTVIPNLEDSYGLENWDE